MRRITTLFFFFIVYQTVLSQQTGDSIRTLDAVVVRAYEQNKRLAEVPAAISVVTPAQMQRFSNTSILPALNSNPGVRMEERSPGSYRLNIRGSSLRSPFGVRNVKVYYDDIPYTDPGGNTYLNQLGFYNIRSLEVIKGPGSSLYGTGTGGVVLLKTAGGEEPAGVTLNSGWGSYNTQNYQLGVRTGSSTFRNTLSYLNLKSNGYRDHSRLDRKVWTWDASVKMNEGASLQSHFIYGDLFYETPGGLTKAQYEADPRASRPAAGPNPGAEQAKAAIYQKFFLAGMSYTQKISKHVDNTTSLYAASQRLHNPFITNYGRTSEPNGGGRTIFRYRNKVGATAISFDAGAEFQLGYSTVKIYDNNGGIPGNLRTDDEIDNRVAFGFAQATVEWGHGISVTAGASINRQRIIITRLSDIPPSENKRTYRNELAPRIAVLKKIGKSLSLYANYARGFSPPTTAELLPSAGIISTDLDAEAGNDVELGIKGNLLQNRLFLDVNGFLYGLQNTIVQRRDSTGADYFVNAGATRQNGIETYLRFLAWEGTHSFWSQVTCFLSYNYYDFIYKNYEKAGTDFSGKQLPSVPKQTLTLGGDINTVRGWYLNLTFSHNDRIPLDDANANWADAYDLLSARIGFRKKWNRTRLDLYVSGDNLLDETYSLGNDINAFGGRFYNAAARRSYFAGFALQWLFPQKP